MRKEIRKHQEENKLTFNLTYYSAFQSAKTILEELQILLAPGKDHQKVFPNVPIVVPQWEKFKRPFSKSLSSCPQQHFRQ